MLLYGQFSWDNEQPSFIDGITSGKFLKEMVEGTADLAAGVVDTLTFGGTHWLRGALGVGLGR